MRNLSQVGIHNKIAFYLILAFVSLFLCLFPAVYLRAQEAVPEAETVAPEPEEKPLVIVLDPGHGGMADDGRPEGGVYEGFIEKELNLIVAESMKEELEKYENVTVYLT